MTYPNIRQNFILWHIFRTVYVVLLLLLFSFHSTVYSRCCRRRSLLVCTFSRLYARHEKQLFEKSSNKKIILGFLSFPSFFCVLYVAGATTVYRSIRDDRVYGMKIFLPFSVCIYTLSFHSPHTTLNFRILLSHFHPTSSVSLSPCFYLSFHHHMKISPFFIHLIQLMEDFFLFILFYACMTV